MNTQKNSPQNKRNQYAQADRIVKWNSSIHEALTHKISRKISTLDRTGIKHS